MAIIGAILLILFIFSYVIVFKDVAKVIKQGEKLKPGQYFAIGFACFMLIVFFQALGVIVVIIGGVAWFMVSSNKEIDSD